MKMLPALFLAMFAINSLAQTNFEGMLEAAKRGDAGARLLIAYTYYFGEYRDGTPIEKDLNKAYTWASLANFQGNADAKKLVNGLIPQLQNRDQANTLAGEYFKLYGAAKNSESKSVKHSFFYFIQVMSFAAEEYPTKRRPAS